MPAALVWATVHSGAPTLKRAKRRTLMFSPSLRDLRGDELRDGLRCFLDEGLIEEAELFVELGELAFEHLLDDVGGLAGGCGLGAIDVLLALEVGGGDVVAADEARVDGGDVHGDVAEQLLEVVGAGDEVGLAVELEEDADLSAGVDVGSDCALIGGAGGLLGSRGHAALAEDDEGVFHVAFGFLEGLEAVAHGGAGLFAEFLDEFCVDLYGGISHDDVPNPLLMMRREC